MTTVINSSPISVPVQTNGYVAPTPGQSQTSSAGGYAQNVPIGTAATTVLTYTPTTAGNYEVGAYAAATAAANLTLTVSWTDAAGQVQNTLMNNAAIAPGSPESPPVLFVSATAGQPITITGTASAANSITVSASIR